MSLIINMLKDLEKRHNSNTVSPPLAAYEHDESDYTDIIKKIMIGAAALLALSFLLYLITHRSTHTVSQAITSETAISKTDEIQNSENEAWLNPVGISAVSFETNENSTEISVMLTHPALYRLGMDKDGKIALIIDNAVMHSDLPTLIGAEVGIQGMRAASEHGNIKFIISLKPDAFLQSTQLTSDAKNPTLVITIGNKEDAPEAVIASTNSIKTPAIQSIVIGKYQQALKLAEAGYTQEAINNLEKILQFYPDYHDVRVSLAAMILESGNPAQARRIIDDGLAMTPDYLPLIELKARVLTSEGKISDALMVLQSEQPLITDAPEYHAFIAALFSRENNHKLAAEIYQKLVQINPHEGSWWFGLAVSMDKLGRNQDAIYAYSKAATEGRLNAQAMAFLRTRLQVLQEQPNVKE